MTTTAKPLDYMDYFGPWLLRAGQRYVSLVIPVAHRSEERRIRDWNEEYRSRMRNGLAPQTCDTSNAGL